MISRMKSLELENQTLHKGEVPPPAPLSVLSHDSDPPPICTVVVGEMRAALQKLESRVAVLEKSPAPAAVPSAKVRLVRV